MGRLPAHWRLTLSLTRDEGDLLHRMLIDYVTNTASMSRRVVAERILAKLTAARSGDPPE